MKVFVPVKRVPDTAAQKRITADGTVDREGVESILCPVNEFALEEAMRLKEKQTVDARAILIGPESAQHAIRRALSFGLDGGIHVVDDEVAGTDALGTAKVIAGVLRQLEWDLVIFGNQSTDGRTGLVPAATAELLGVPSLTSVRHMTVDGDRIVVHRENEEGWDVVSCSLPAIVSVVEAINEPRYPSLKSTLSARSKPVDVWHLLDLGLNGPALEPAALIFEWKSRPSRTAGQIVYDDETDQAASQLVQWLEAKKLI